MIEVRTGDAVGSDKCWQAAMSHPKVKLRIYEPSASEERREGVSYISSKEIKQEINGVVDVPELVKEVANRLDKSIPKREYIKNLIYRNVFQIMPCGEEESDILLAVSKINFGKGVCEGGTGWTVEMADVLGVPCYVFDTQHSQWYKKYGSRFLRAQPLKIIESIREYLEDGMVSMTMVGTRKPTLKAIEEIGQISKEIKGLLNG